MPRPSILINFHPFLQYFVNVPVHVDLESASFSSMVTCHGFTLATDVLIVSRFGQKCLLNVLNVNINVSFSPLGS